MLGKPWWLVDSLMQPVCYYSYFITEIYRVGQVWFSFGEHTMITAYGFPVTCTWKTVLRLAAPSHSEGLSWGCLDHSCSGPLLACQEDRSDICFPLHFEHSSPLPQLTKDDQVNLSISSSSPLTTRGCIPSRPTEWGMSSFLKYEPHFCEMYWKMHSNLLKNTLKIFFC